MSTPIALTIAGSDSGGGAGIQADLKTFSALRVYGASAIAALTAQNTREVRAIHPVPADFVASQIDAVFDDLAVGAVKIGMLGGPPVIQAVADALERHGATAGAKKIVLDPVMVAKSGDALLPTDAVAALRQMLVPRARIITPNLPEAGVLAGAPAPTNREEMAAIATRLMALGAEAVLLKGGHLVGETSADLFLDASGARWLEAPRIATRNTHGTGCTLSAAIAAGLAKGHALGQAVDAAKAYIGAAIAAADRLEIGSGHGPVHHFHALWDRGEN